MSEVAIWDHELVQRMAPVPSQVYDVGRPLFDLDSTSKGLVMVHQSDALLDFYGNFEKTTIQQPIWVLSARG